MWFLFFFSPGKKEKPNFGMDSDPNLCFYSTQNIFKSKP